MKVYFACATAEFEAYRRQYWAIRDTLVRNGHVLTRDWLRDADERLGVGATDRADIQQIYRACVQAIREAELVVVEDTVSNFSTGHQITLALQLKKPTLVLWRSTKQRQFEHMFIEGIESDLLELAEYTDENLAATVQTFLSKYADSTERNRFHLVLHGVERAYLDWAQYVQGKSRTRVIRDALQAQISEDSVYNQYLSQKHTT